ncbi:MAG: hypothetical protein F4011_06100 [Acidimicrobiaceae bacterium]|nr:hypothetical protein [Acidimicrobiaceae bacterium]MYG99632.1 hypothetical protein [Acidimicrobiaceae bacterium]MYL03741.1 hypothetical protein [Acidimicrobiaceae bacterium]
MCARPGRTPRRARCRAATPRSWSWPGSWTSTPARCWRATRHGASIPRRPTRWPPVSWPQPKPAAQCCGSGPNSTNCWLCPTGSRSSTTARCSDPTCRPSTGPPSAWPWPATRPTGPARQPAGSRDRHDHGRPHRPATAMTDSDTRQPAPSVTPSPKSTWPPKLDGWLDAVARRATAEGILSSILVPLVSALAALVVGGVLIAIDGVNPLSVYGAILQGVFTKSRGFSYTATVATPLVLIGVGYALAYRARVFTIGGEGQYLVGAVAGTAVVTAGGVGDLPRVVLIVVGLGAAIVAGALWGGLAGVLANRFGASIVISTLMLSFIGDSLLQWAVRDGIRDPDSYNANSRPISAAALPSFFGQKTHLGFLFALVLVPIAWWLIRRHRWGFRIDARGHNPGTLNANEFSSARVTLSVLVVAGGLAGLAGMVETTGVNVRLGQEASVGYGWDAIIVALIGRLHPLGVLVAGLGMAGLTIGFESAQRQFELPSSLVSLITAFVIIFVVWGDAIAARWKESR